MAQGNSLIKNTAIYALGDITPKVLGLLVLPIMTSYLLPSQYGIINYVNAIVTFMSIVSMLSLNTYYLVHYYRQPDELNQQKLLGSLTIFTLIVNVAIAVVLFAFGKPLFGILGKEVEFYPFIALGVGTNFMQMFSVLPSALYRLKERPLTLSALVVLRSLLQVGLGIVFVVWYSAGALGVLWANFIVATVFALIFTVITYRNSILIFDWHIVKKALKFSLPLLPGALAYYFVSLSDRIFIEKYLNISDLGIYTTAANLALMLNIISYGAYKAYEPQFFKKYGDADFTTFFNRTRNGFLFVMLLAVMAIGLFSREFFYFFTAPAYHSAYFYVPMMLAGVLFFAISSMYGTVVTARGKTKISSAVMIVGGAVSVTLNIILLPKLGIAAATITSGASFGVMMVGNMIFSKVKIDHIAPTISMLIVAAVLYVGVYIIPAQSLWLALIVKGGLLVIACVAIVLLLKIRYKKIITIFTGK